MWSSLISQSLVGLKDSWFRPFFFSYALISIPSAIEGWISESQFQWAPAQLVGWFSNFQYQISLIEVFYYTFFLFNKHNFDLHLFNLITCSQGEIPLCTYDATQIYLSIMICNKKSGIFRILWLQRWRICFFSSSWDLITTCYVNMFSFSPAAHVC